MRDAVIVDAVRTHSGRGSPGGALAAVHPVDLLARPLSALVDRTGVDPGRIDDIMAGCVTQVREQSQNIDRWGMLAAGLPESVPATTVDRQRRSSQQALHFAAQGVMAGAYNPASSPSVPRCRRGANDVAVRAPRAPPDPSLPRHR